MTTTELVTAIRTRFDDLAVPYLVPTATIEEQLSLTQTEFARATLVLYATASATITSGDPWLVLPSNFFVLKTVVLNDIQLRPITLSEMDFGYYTLNNIENSSRFDNWRAATGTPKFVIVDMYADQVRLVPYPDSNDTVIVEGYKVPANVVSNSVDPEIPEMYHELLIVGTLFRLYTMFDVDVFEPTKIQVYATQWAQGIIEAQDNLRTNLRRHIRVMDLPRGNSFGPKPIVNSNDQ